MANLPLVNDKIGVGTVACHDEALVCISQLQPHVLVRTSKHIEIDDIIRRDLDVCTVAVTLRLQSQCRPIIR